MKKFRKRSDVSRKKLDLSKQVDWFLKYDKNHTRYKTVHDGSGGRREHVYEPQPHRVGNAMISRAETFRSYYYKLENNYYRNNNR